MNGNLSSHFYCHGESSKCRVSTWKADRCGTRLANGKISEAVPLADGYASLEGDAFVRGLFSISENAAVVAGMNFLARCGKVLILAPNGMATIDVGEYENWLK